MSLLHPQVNPKTIAAKGTQEFSAKHLLGDPLGLLHFFIRLHQPDTATLMLLKSGVGNLFV